MCNLISILSRDAIEKQHFNYLMRFKSPHAITQKPLFHTLAVTVMQFAAHLDAP
jgi:hypothetical protein